MRIGFLGNTNNYPFMLARALRRQGHDVVFLVDSRERLHRPENRYDDVTEAYGAWIQDVSPLTPLDCTLPTARGRRVLASLRRCDAVVLNGLGPSFLARVGCPALALLSGSDLLFLGNPITLSKIVTLPSRFGAEAPWYWNVIRRAVYADLVRRQRAGIRAATDVSFFTRGLVPDGDALLDGLGVSDERRWFAHITDLDLVRVEPEPSAPPLRVFSATRLTWRRNDHPGISALDLKGSDIMVRGLALYRRRTGGEMAVRLVRKGMDVAETERLVESEGIGRCVTWLEEMSQREILDEFRGAHVVIEQLAEGSIGMAGLDAMAMGRPVIANFRPERLGASGHRVNALCQARSAEEVCGHLERLASDPDARRRAGQVSRVYVESFHSVDSAARTLLERLFERPRSSAS